MKNPAQHEVFALADKNIPLLTIDIDFGAGERLFDSHWHREIEILYFTKGSMQVICEDNVYVAHAGDIIFVNPSELHSGRTLDEDVEYHCFIIDPDFFMSLHLDICDKQIIKIANAREKINNLIHDEKIRHLLDQVLMERDAEKESYNLFIKGYLTLLMSEVCRNYKSSEQTIIEKDNTISKILHYINENYAHELTSSKLAAHFGYSLSYFCKYFRDSVGETPVDYINAVRINKSYDLLLYTDMTATEISYQVGYSGLNYFSRQFKKRLHYSPQEIRKMYRAENEKLL